jgi:phosphate transport system substrate-binding protein
MKHACSNFRRRRPASISVSRGIAAAGITLLLATTAGSASGEVLRTGGPGAVTKILQRIGAAFTEREPGTTLVVMPNLGSAGAIAGVSDGLLDFAVSGRPLKPEEAKSLTAIVLASTPFGLASSNPNPGNIKCADVAAFYRNSASVWPDGTPVRVVLRPKSEVDAALLANTFPNMAAAVEQLRERKEIPVVATDQDNVLLAEKLPGSLTAVTLTQVLTENAHLHFVAIDGVEPTLENFERGAYPYRKDFHFVFSHGTKPVVERFIAFLRSAEGERLLREAGNLAPRP